MSIDNYERSLSFLSAARNGMKSVDCLMKLHGAFPSTPNKLWVRSTSCFCQNCFGTSSKPETACDGWRMFDLQRKKNPSVLSSSEKAAEIPENEAVIVPDINDHLRQGMIGRSILAKCLRSMILMLKSYL